MKRLIPILILMLTALALASARKDPRGPVALAPAVVNNNGSIVAPLQAVKVSLAKKSLHPPPDRRVKKPPPPPSQPDGVGNKNPPPSQPDGVGNKNPPPSQPDGVGNSTPPVFMATPVQPSTIDVYFNLRMVNPTMGIASIGIACIVFAYKILPIAVKSYWKFKKAA
ncbi:hypothetical protein P8452_12463 [Trifolium repens]|nr:hypothetical protein P8452_12463 [Trifolium repens]